MYIYIHTAVSQLVNTLPNIAKSLSEVIFLLLEWNKCEEIHLEKKWRSYVEGSITSNTSGGALLG